MMAPRGIVPEGALCCAIPVEQNNAVKAPLMTHCLVTPTLHASRSWDAESTFWAKRKRLQAEQLRAVGAQAGANCADQVRTFCLRRIRYCRASGPYAPRVVAFE